MKAVFYQKPDSPYDDERGRRYHFPSQYRARVENALNDWIVYYGPIVGKPGRYYSGVARVDSIQPDTNRDKHFYAFLSGYLEFDIEVDYRANGGYEKKLIRPDGKISGGQAQNAVRNITNSEFASIVDAGFSKRDEWPDRYDSEDDHVVVSAPGFEEEPQADLVGEPFDRPIVAQLVNKKWRDAKFRQHVRIAYDRTCAFTSLRLINGQGRPEVEAAHIRPVEMGGNDSVRNGIALSGTVHWMFDRGLLSLTDDFMILKSRYLNHDVSHLLNGDMQARIPTETRYQPHPEYLGWHREHVFKH